VYNTIVVGTDLSDSAAKAVEQAADLAKAAGAKLHVVCAFKPAMTVSVAATSLEAMAYGGADIVLEAESKLADEVESALDRISRGLAEKGVGHASRRRRRSGGRPGRHRGADGRRSHRRGEPRHGRGEAVRPRERPEQDLAPLAVLGVDREDQLGTVRVQAGPAPTVWRWSNSVEQLSSPYRPKLYGAY